LANQVGTSVSVPLPVFNRNQGEIERAEAEALIARREVEKLRLAIPQEVRSAVASYTIARERVARFEDAFLRQAGEARHAAEVEGTSLADLNGTIEFDEERTARLAAPVPGRVVQLLVQAGDRVDADQPLVALESPEVKAAQADYVRADGDSRLARKAAERAT